MKNHIIALAVISLLAACTSPQKNESDLLIQQRDSLKEVYSKVGSELSAIEAKIASLDSSITVPFVTVQLAEKKPFNHYFSVQGNVTTNLNALIYPEAQGIVKQIFVREGSKVSKGQKILEIDSELAQTNLKELEVNYELAKDIYERQEKLWKQNIGSEVQYLEAKSRKESLESSIDRVKEQIRMASVAAPFSGILEEVIPNVGEMATPAMPVCRVVDLEDMYITADISEKRLSDVSIGMPVAIVLANDKEVMGEITRIGSFIKPENRTFEVRVDFKEDPGMLRPNLFATMKINHIQLNDVISLPASLIKTDAAGQDYIWVVNEKDNKQYVEKRVVSKGIANQTNVLIESGLEAGESVIEKGGRKVQDGIEVKTSLDQQVQG